MLKNIKLSFNDVELINSALKKQNGMTIGKLEKMLPKISEYIIPEGDGKYRVNVMLRILMEDIEDKHNDKIIELDIDEIDLIQSVIEKGKYKDLLSLEKKLPNIRGEIKVNPMKASTRLNNSMMETYMTLSKTEDILIKNTNNLSKTQTSKET